jgi:hypothetical protein
MAFETTKMAFETRKVGGNKYLYLCKRDAKTGRVVKQYLGRGARAEAAAKALDERRKRQADERLAVERRRAELQAVDAVMAELEAAAITLMEAALLAAGFHRVNYSRWRRRRK